MMTMTTTVTAGENVAILRLRPPLSLQERVDRLLSELKSSSLLSEEEKTALLQGEGELKTDQKRALAYILLHVVQPSMIRQFQRELLSYESRLSALLQESLPAEVLVEDFIKDFKEKERAFERLCQKMAALEIRRKQLFAKANLVNDQIQKGEEEFTQEFASLQQRRIETTHQITNEVISTAADLTKEAEKGKEIGRRTLAVGERMKKDQRKLDEINAKVEKILEGVDG